MRPKIVCKIHVLIKAVWEEKPTQQSFVDYKQMKRQMFLQFLFQNLHHLLSVSMTLTVVSSDRQHCRLSMMQMTASMDKWLWTPWAGSCSTHRQFWNSGVIAVNKNQMGRHLANSKDLLSGICRPQMNDVSVEVTLQVQGAHESPVMTQHWALFIEMWMQFMVQWF